MNLHEIRTHHPFDHVQPLTAQILTELSRRDPEHEPDDPTDWLSGHLERIWLEDRKVYGLWRYAHTDVQYILRLNDYDPDNRYGYSMRELQNMANDMVQHPEWYTYTAFQYHTFDVRPDFTEANWLGEARR